MSRFRWASAVVFLAMALLLGGCGHASRVTAKNLVGVWHACPGMCPNWDDRYVFFADGTVRFVYSQNDLDKRVIDFAGTWRLDKSQLVLTIVKRTVIEDGELVNAWGPESSELELINGTVVEKKVDPPEQSTLTLGPLEKDQSYFPHTTLLKIGDVQFWKWSDDPTIDVDN